jgi:hypothetical protein
MRDYRSNYGWDSILLLLSYLSSLFPSFPSEKLLIHASSMYYHFAILLLFRPFWNLEIFESTTLPRTVCSEAAQSIFVLIRSYKDLYTLRRTPSFVPYIILTASLAYVADIKGEMTGDGMTSLAHGSEGLTFLEEMCKSHFFARRSVEIIKFFTEKWGLQVPEHDALRPRSPHSDGEDQPNTTLAFPQKFTFFRPHLRSAGHVARGHGFSILDMIFSPFPEQGQNYQNKAGTTHGRVVDERNRWHARTSGFEALPDECRL